MAPDSVIRESGVAQSHQKKMSIKETLRSPHTANAHLRGGEDCDRRSTDQFLVYMSFSLSASDISVVHAGRCIISERATRYLGEVPPTARQRPAGLTDSPCLKLFGLYTGGAAIAAPLPVLLILSLPMAGQREELYSLLKGATLLPYTTLLTAGVHCPP